MMNEKSVEVRRAETLTIAASCCGVTGETVLTDSAIILLYASSLGAGNSGALFSTSVLPLFNGLAVIPMAGLAPGIGVKKLALTATAVSAIGYMIAALAPYLGGANTVILGVTCAALVQAGFIAGWFPLLNSFLQPENRVSFLGKMRFFHQISATAFVLLAGFWAGENPEKWHLQIMVTAAAIIFCGRFFCILAVPDFPVQRSGAGGNFLKNLKRAAADPVLRRFSFYQCLFNLGSYGMIPLALLYMKRIGVPDNITVIISGLSFFGMISGYWLIRYLTGKTALRSIVAGLGLLCIPAAAGFLFLREIPETWGYILLALCLIGTSFSIAAFSVISSAVMMNLSPADNSAMSMAFNNAFYYGSAGLSRLLLSWITGMVWFEQFRGVFCGTGFGLLFFLSGMIMLFAVAISPFIFRNVDQKL